MEEFAYFLKLGNELEKQQKLVMAYGAYAEAGQRGDEKSRAVIDGFLPVLVQKISCSPQERNQEIKTGLLEWMQQGMAAEAFYCYQNILLQLKGEDWIDQDNAVLYHCLRIWAEETRMQENAPLDFSGRDMQFLADWYYQLKFMARRRREGLCREEEFSAFLLANGISKTAAEYMIEAVSIEPEYPVKEQPSYDEDYEGGVAFIIPVSDERLFAEAEFYIRHLKVPLGMTVEVVPVRGAASMAEAYNLGMNRTKARYKIYLHQDVMLLDQSFIYEICEIFQDPSIGMIGVAGVGKLPDSGIWWENDGKDDYRNLYQDVVMVKGHTLHNRFEESFRQVEAVDGALMVTQYDVPWREDLFKGWHFYDISQCMEFQKRNLKIVAAGQPYGVWCLHEQKWNKPLGEDFHRAKECFLKAYRMGGEGSEEPL